jgi:anti-sigma factor RsiW
MGLRHLSGIELTEYADGETPSSKRDRVEEHVRGCPRCAAAAASLRDAVSAVGALKAVAPPVDLRQRVEERMAAPSAMEITCRQAVPLLHGQLDECLSPTDEAVLAQHVAACGLCRAEVAALRAARRLVASLPSVESPNVIRESVAAARRTRAPEMPWRARWAPALAAASVVVVGGLALLIATRQPVGTSPGVRVAEDRPAATAPAVMVAEHAGRVAEPEEVAEDGEVEAAVIAEESLPSDSPTPAERRIESHGGVVLVSVGPAPLPTVLEASVAEVPVPSALRTLRQVAQSVSHEHGVQHAMELAGERFATLDMERVLARLPSGLGTESGEDAGVVREEPAPAPPVEVQPSDDGGRDGDSAWAPREGAASPFAAPFV